MYIILADSYRELPIEILVKNVPTFAAFSLGDFIPPQNHVNHQVQRMMSSTQDVPAVGVISGHEFVNPTVPQTNARIFRKNPPEKLPATFAFASSLFPRPISWFSMFQLDNDEPNLYQFKNMAGQPTPA